MKQITHIAASVNGQNRRGRSSLYKWVWEHFDQLSHDRQGRADWIAATEQLSALGLTGTGGAPLKPDNVRKVWERVMRNRRAIAASTPPAMSLPPAISLPPAMPAPPPRPSPSFASPEPVAFEFRTLRKTPIKKQE
jgi:hypothetical protein